MRVRLTLFMLLLLGSHSVIAETISGRVTDNGAAVPHAYVILYEVRGDVIVNAVYSDNDGNYQITVAPGRYSICVSAEEYAYECVKGVVVSKGDAAVNIAVTPAAFVEKKGDAASEDCY